MDYPAVAGLQDRAMPVPGDDPRHVALGRDHRRALLMGTDKRSAAEFSFFLRHADHGGAAFALDLYKNYEQAGPGRHGDHRRGFIMAFIAGVIVVRSLLDFVSRHGFAPVCLVAHRRRHGGADRVVGWWDRGNAWRRLKWIHLERHRSCIVFKVLKRSLRIRREARAPVNYFGQCLDGAGIDAIGPARSPGRKGLAARRNGGCARIHHKLRSECGAIVLPMNSRPTCLSQRLQLTVL